MMLDGGLYVGVMMPNDARWRPLMQNLVQPAAGGHNMFTLELCP